MSDSNATRWCPCCHRTTCNAPLPQLAEDIERIEPISAGEAPQGFRRQYYCVECQQIWPAVELPWELVSGLLSDRQALEDARRQIALLRYFLAQARRATADAPAAEQPAQPLQQLRLAG
jgi:hypothetical protein